MEQKPNDEFSAWDDAKYSLGGCLVLLLPVLLVLALVLLVL